MLSKAVEFENAFTNYASREIDLRYYLENSYIEVGGTAVEILSSDWVHVRRITKFHEIFYLLTLKISGSLYVTSNIHFLKICVVVVYLNQLIASEDTDLSNMARKMKEKFDKYWGDPIKINKIIFISCVLDPRYKLDSVAYALVKMFGENQGLSLKAAVKEYMILLFNEYVKSSSKGLGVAVSSPCSLLEMSTLVISGSQLSTQVTGPLDSLMQDLKQYKVMNGGVHARTELDKYFEEETEDDIEDFNISPWWKMNATRFPILAKMACDVLDVPVSSITSESAFSTI
ncbi:zinc finger BED domain-containing protein DAYSLEEPER-like [Capsicum annuum]|uniref:zinc finger BED domain-containing protein DAYSLEEPER-like n=1 Tax=Capsicum annuum TaxID=4072 RepID=UPI001FB0D574|nr:zinc finger BED domain-containing protein DAYSLEEPER-like [Capsicum annuum]